MSNAPDKQQIEGLRFIAEHMSLDEFIISVNRIKLYCMTEQVAQLMISRFKLIKSGLL